MFEGFRIIFVEDDKSVRSSVTETLELAGFSVSACESAESALRHIAPGLCGIVISDVQLPGMDGLALLRNVIDTDPAIPVILVTGHGYVSMAVQAIHEGAYDFIEKPYQMGRLIEIATRAMEEVRRQILNLADTSADVLIVGETGTGKELVARCLHDHSQRRKANFVAINCGGLPETLFESEIFGHEAGAFTNAGKRRIGKIEHAHGGTLLLDEIESMPLPFQIKLLRTLQERKIERLGSNEEIRIDFRIVAATKSDLKELCAQQKFRSDLYYRLNVAVLELPPLRERREDIPILFEQFVLQAALRYGREAPTLSGHQLRRLMAGDWPGNVRELRNVADRFVLGLLSTHSNAVHAVEPVPQTLVQQMDIFEKALIEQTLTQYAGRPMAVSEALGIAKKTLYDKMHRHGIVIENYRPLAGGDSSGG